MRNSFLDTMLTIVGLSREMSGETVTVTVNATASASANVTEEIADARGLLTPALEAPDARLR